MKNLLQRSSVTLGAMVFSVAPMAAQRVCAVENGQAVAPGSAFGVTNYTCSSCNVRSMRDSSHVVYSFAAEPVVLETEHGSPLQPGDVIVAVNGNPITTRAGADQFAYPPLGSEVVLTVRRGGGNTVIHTVLATYMDFTVSKLTGGGASRGAVVTPDSTTQLCDRYVEPRTGIVYGAAGGARSGRGSAGGMGGATAGGRGGAAIGGGVGGRSSSGGIGGVGRLDSTMIAQLGRLTACRNLTVTDSAARRLACADTSLLFTPKAVMSSAGGRGGAVGGSVGPANVVASFSASFAQVELKNFGLTLNCHPNCAHARASDGTLYSRFDGYPSLSTPARDGLAARAGLHEGDVVISVNGLSPMTEEGALLLDRSDKELTLNLEISRAGKRQKFVLKL